MFTNYDYTLLVLRTTDFELISVENELPT